jgi:alkyl hydroperoxide reductase subunit F
MLDAAAKDQLRSVFDSLEAYYTLDVHVSPDHPSREELLELLNDLSACSDKIQCRVQEGAGLNFSILKNEQETGIKFRAVPNGHEFTSLLLAILNSDGKGKNIPDEATCRRVKSLKGPIGITTYVSLTCTNCPDVVQSLNLMAVLNSGIRHETVDGAINQKEVERLAIQGVPAVFVDGQLFHSGRISFGELLLKLEKSYGDGAPEETPLPLARYDVLVVGGGPAGSAAAVYSARKGLKVAILTERMGGQVNETTAIENLISTPQTTGAKLSTDLRSHIEAYPIDLLEHRRVEKIEIDGANKVASLAGGERFAAPALILATGASWRRLNVPGEADYIGRGVAFCPHCDGPFYHSKRVAVVGGGNSGIEAAIDLAGICQQVAVFEYLDTLKADRVLQDKLKTLTNVKVFTSIQTLAIVGNGEKVTGIRIKDRNTSEEQTVELDGIFVQIGLTANSSAFQNLVAVNRFGEIEIDARGRTSQPGIYAAGDVSSVPYKQIIIAMGEGAKAALAAFEDRMRGTSAS